MWLHGEGHGSANLESLFAGTVSKTLLTTSWFVIKTVGSWSGITPSYPLWDALNYALRAVTASVESGPDGSGGISLCRRHEKHRFVEVNVTSFWWKESHSCHSSFYSVRRKQNMPMMVRYFVDFRISVYPQLGPVRPTYSVNFKLGECRK